MELYALFDEELVQADLAITYAILSVWSISFLQFIPILKHKNKYKHLESRRMRRIKQSCGDYFSEVVVTLLSILLQDGPFLCLRLYIIVKLELVTYSLVFFVIKNIVSIILLTYKLGAMCIKLPFCYDNTGTVEKVESVDFTCALPISSFHRNSGEVRGNNGNVRPVRSYSDLRRLPNITQMYDKHELGFINGGVAVVKLSTL